jgi:hypothetical protein
VAIEEVVRTVVDKAGGRADGESPADGEVV